MLGIWGTAVAVDVAIKRKAEASDPPNSFLGQEETGTGFGVVPNAFQICAESPPEFLNDRRAGFKKW
jgi:hypothetical protein